MNKTTVEKKIEKIIKEIQAELKCSNNDILYLRNILELDQDEKKMV